MKPTTTNLVDNLRLLIGTKVELLAARRRASAAIADAASAVQEATTNLQGILRDHQQLQARLDQIQQAEAELGRIAEDV